MCGLTRRDRKRIILGLLVMGIGVLTYALVRNWLERQPQASAAASCEDRCCVT